MGKTTIKRKTRRTKLIITLCFFFIFVTRFKAGNKQSVMDAMLVLRGNIAIEVIEDIS
jgi:hypothetical protein